MEWAIALKSQNQAARLRHFCGVVFNCFTRFKCLRDLLRGDIALKHTLNGMGTEEDFRIVH